jgi:hypothetical protein
MTALMKSPDSLDDRLRSRYTEPALVPASPWLGATPPGKPVIALSRDAVTNEYFLKLTPAADEKPWLWTVRRSTGSGWTTEVLPGWLRTHQVLDGQVDRIYVTAVNRTGIESAPAIIGTTSATDASQAVRQTGRSRPPRR